jgi:hypothetical protein
LIKALSAQLGALGYALQTQGVVDSFSRVAPVGKQPGKRKKLEKIRKYWEIGNNWEKSEKLGTNGKNGKNGENGNSREKIGKIREK